MEIDESKDEQLTADEQALFEWTNRTFERFDVRDDDGAPLRVANFQSFRSGIKLLALLKVRLTPNSHHKPNPNPNRNPKLIVV